MDSGLPSGRWEIIMIKWVGRDAEKQTLLSWETKWHLIFVSHPIPEQLNFEKNAQKLAYVRKKQ